MRKTVLATAVRNGENGSTTGIGKEASECTGDSFTDRDVFYRADN